MRSKQLRLSVCLTIAAVIVGAMAVPAVAPAAGTAKNVIVLVPDGCSQSVVTLARWYKGEPLHIDGHARGFVSTYMANSVITGSAAAATAFATGKKTTARFLSVGPRAEDVLENFPEPPESMQYKPLATVLEGAKLMGKATGLVATSRITHATPAAYAAHIHDRGLDNEIMEHMVYQDVDVVFGGGRRHLIPEDQGGRRTDGQDLRQALIDRGYQFVETVSDFQALSSGRAWGMFNDSHMNAEMDRVHYGLDEPSLAEMTRKAIDLLSQDADGFFLMVEGSQVDWAGHANDPGYMVTDFLAFDEAFQVAIDFAEQDGETMVLAFPDHNTGGLALGNRLCGSSSCYTTMTIEEMIGPLQGMQISSFALAGEIGDDLSPSNIQSAISEFWGIDITIEHANEIIELMDAGLSLDYAISTIVSDEYTYFGWTTYGHSGEDVPLWSYGPHRPVGLLDNTQIARRTASILGFKLNAIDQLLFVDAAAYCSDCTLDMSDPENPVLTDGNCSLETSKDILHVDSLGMDVRLPGITVYAPMTEKTYIPLMAVALMDAFNGGAGATDYQQIAEQRYRELLSQLRLDPSEVPTASLALD
jgi:alkaline phosphatase